MNRRSIRQFALAIVLAGMAVLVSSRPAEAGWHEGYCAPEEWGCGYMYGAQPYCFDVYTCLEDPYNPGNYLGCVCDGNALCDWVPGYC